jgi:hypothetical protein
MVISGGAVGAGVAGAHATNHKTASRLVLSKVEGLVLSQSPERSEGSVEGPVFKIERNFISLHSFSFLLT